MDIPTIFQGRLLDMKTSGCHCCRHARVLIADRKIDCIEETPAHTGGSLLMAPFANGHDHMRGVKPISLGAFDLPLELWLTAMTNIPKVDPYLVAAKALGRQVLGGVGTIMIHYTRPNDANAISEELETVARAATDIGVRVAIAVSMRDRNPLGYGPDATILKGLEPADQEAIREKLIPSMRSAQDQVKLVEDLAARIESPLVSVQFGPYGAEWCSRPLLETIAARSAETGRRVHMHLLESDLQRAYLDHIHNDRPIHFLDEIGLLSERLSVAHGVWLRPDEMDLLAERRVTVSTNATSNLSLRAGKAPVVEMIRRGVPLAIGLDGFSFDDDDDAFREVRLNYLLHKGVGLKDGLSIDQLLAAVCYGGRWSVSGIPHGDGIEAGAPGDLMELDYASISNDIVMEADPAGVLVHRGTARMMKRMVIAGRTVVAGGTLTNIDLEEVTKELDAQVLHGIPAFRSWQQVSAKLGERLKDFYQAGLHRCG